MDLKSYVLYCSLYDMDTNFQEKEFVMKPPH